MALPGALPGRPVGRLNWLITWRWDLLARDLGHFVLAMSCRAWPGRAILREVLPAAHRQTTFQNRHRDVDVILVDDQRWAKPNGVLTGAKQ